MAEATHGPAGEAFVQEVGLDLRVHSQVHANPPAVADESRDDGTGSCAARDDPGRGVWCGGEV